jgi:hypothetical protein
MSTTRITKLKALLTEKRQELELLVRDYIRESDESLLDIADKFRFSYYYVWNVAQRHGIKRR